MKVFRELATLIDSFRSCIVSMFWSFFMLFLLLYVFALVFVQGLHGYLLDHSKGNADPVDPKVNAEILQRFGSVRVTMLSLYMCVTGGTDWNTPYEVVALSGKLYQLIFIFFTFFFIFAIFNILTGTFVEKAVNSATPDREEVLMTQRENMLKSAAISKNAFEMVDQNHDQRVSLDEFKTRMNDPLFTAFMASIGLELQEVELFFRVVCGESTEMELDQFVEGCISMKGGATALDMQKQLFETRKVVKRVHAEFVHVKSEFVRVNHRLDAIDHAVLETRIEV